MLVAVLATVPRAGDRDALRRPKAWTIGSTPAAGGALIEPAGAPEGWCSPAHRPCRRSRSRLAPYTEGAD
jgi:hypothetical protein